LDIDIKSLVASRIRELRESQNLTQEQLAWKADVDRTYMNHVENGRRNISIETLDKIVQGLEVSLPDFFSTELFQKTKRKSK
jgi:transcriptional regulator with XRE-family HTH domain